MDVRLPTVSLLDSPSGLEQQKALVVNKVFDCKTLAVTVYYYAISSNVIPKSPEQKVDNA